MPASAFSVAEYVLFHCKHALTPLHINMLVYFSHAWNLVMHERPLISEDVEAWKYGPVIQSVYHSFRERGTLQVSKTMHFQPLTMEQAENSVNLRFDEPSRDIMNQVIEIYAGYTGAELLSLTNMRDGPWDKVYDKTRTFTTIHDCDIHDYYKDKLETKAAAQRAS